MRRSANQIRIRAAFLSGLALITIGSITLAATTGNNPKPDKSGDLKTLIKEKTEDLREIEEERAKLKNEVDEISKIKGTLFRDIGAINYDINQLDLSIKSNKINLEKIGFELEAIDEDTRLIGIRIGEHKKTINKLILRLYQRDRDNFLMVFLRNPTLASGVSEIQSIINLNSDLAVSIDELRNLQGDLARQSAFALQKKSEREMEKRNFQYRQQIAADQRAVKQTLLARTKEEEKIYEEQIAELDKQQSEISAVIDEVEKELRASFNPDLVPAKRPGVFSYPVQNPAVTQSFGETKFARRAYRSKIHNGTDLKASVGTPIFAAADGIVRAVDNNDISAWRKYQYGAYIMIDHGINLSSLYAHLSHFLVSEGETVTRGQLIAYSGNTGYTTGAHLHFGVYLTQTLLYKKISPARGLVPIGIFLNPEDYL